MAVNKTRQPFKNCPICGQEFSPKNLCGYVSNFKIPIHGQCLVKSKQSILNWLNYTNSGDSIFDLIDSQDGKDYHGN